MVGDPLFYRLQDRIVNTSVRKEMQKIETILDFSLEGNEEPEVCFRFLLKKIASDTSLTYLEMLQRIEWAKEYCGYLQSDVVATALQESIDMPY